MNMKKHCARFAAAVFLSLICCCIFLPTASAWNFENGVLRITSNLGDYRWASSSSDYSTTSPFEEAGIESQVTSIVVAEGVTTIGCMNFYGMNNVTSVSLPSTLTSIKSDAFRSCTKLTSISIPANVRTLGTGAFVNAGITTITFLGDAPGIDYYSAYWGGYVSDPVFNYSQRPDAFYSSQRSWTAEKMGKIGSGLLWHDIEYVSSGTCGTNASWTYYNYHTLKITGSGALNSYSSGNETPWSMFNNEITSVVVGSGITSISSYSFEYMQHLQSVSLPSTLTTLACNAFNSCSELPSITIPASLTSFEPSKNFNGCNALTDIYYVGSEEEWQQIANYQDCKRYGKETAYHFITLHEAKEATCTEAGNDGYYAFDGTNNTDVYSLDKVRLARAPIHTALGHNWDTVNYVWSDDNSQVTATRICKRDTSHVETETANVTSQVTRPATCETKGSTTYSAVFENTVFRTQTKLLEDIDALGHDLKHHEAVAATCAENGTVEHWECENCHRCFDDNQATNDITDMLLIAKTAHTLTEHPAVGQTCTKEGNIAYWICSGCGKMFSDEGETEIETYILQPLGHLPVVDPEVPATYESTGLTEGSHCQRCGEVLTAQQEIPMLVEVIDSGECGPKLTWELTNTGVLTITGTGYMSSSPWNKASIKRVEIGEGVKSVSESAFYQCANLKEVSLPTTLKAIEEKSFCRCGALETINLPDGLVKIGDNAFNGCESLNTVIIPDSVNQLGDFAFYLSGLTTVEISANLTSIGSCTFAYTNLSSVTIPDKVASIGEGAFLYCTSLAEVVIPNSVIQMDVSVFSHCSSLESITIPNKLETIPKNAFNGCTSLESVTIPDGVSIIGESSFSDCIGLTEIELPGSVYWVMDYAFSGCTELADFSIQRGNNPYIYETAFSNCHSLRNVTINGLVSFLGTIFDDSYELESIIIPECNAYTIGQLIDSGYEDYLTITPHVESAASPIVDPTLTEDGLTSGTECQICGEALKERNTIHALQTLSVLYLPEDLLGIEAEAFKNLACEAVIIPEKCTKIGSMAFADCKNLIYVKIPASVDDYPENAFAGCNENLTISWNKDQDDD